jgi:gliding motility-associated-like protein
LILIDGITGCSAEFEVEVLPPTPINILATGAEPPNCNGGNDGWIEVLTDAGNDAVFTWSLPGVDDAYVDGLSAGTYSVLVTNASNCADSATVILTDFPVLTVDLVEMTPSECGESNGSLVVSGGGGQGGYDFSWTLFQNNSTLDGVDEGNYDVEVTDAGGCTVQGTFPVDCYPLTPIIVNQLITPNDDGFNDVWIIDNLFMYPDNKVQIFNRWGTEVFEADPYENDWTGFWDRAIGSNKLLPAGTYYYLIDTRKKSQKPYRGFIELQHEER